MHPFDHHQIAGFKRGLNQNPLGLALQIGGLTAHHDRQAARLGTDHAAEAVMGFFTKFGDGACDLAPLSGLVKKQVRAIAAHLGAPQHLVMKTPTADLEELQQREHHHIDANGHQPLHPYHPGNIAPFRPQHLAIRVATKQPAVIYTYIFGPETYAGWFTGPSNAEAGVMQEQVDLAEASGLGRVALDSAMPGAANPASFAFQAPAFDDPLRAEFFG